MANRSSFAFKGGAELEAVLAGLPGKLGDQVLNKILRKAAGKGVRRARELSSNADVTGETTRSIGVVSNRAANTVTFGPRRGNGFKGQTAHLLEYGTAPHIIKAKPGKVLNFPGGPAASVSHPGSAAQPFMRPAYDETKDEMLQSIKDQCLAIIADGFRNVTRIK